MHSLLNGLLWLLLLHFQGTKHKFEEITYELDEKNYLYQWPASKTKANRVCKARTLVWNVTDPMCIIISFYLGKKISKQKHNVSEKEKKGGHFEKGRKLNDRNL